MKRKLLFISLLTFWTLIQAKDIQSTIFINDYAVEMSYASDDYIQTITFDKSISIDGLPYSVTEIPLDQKLHDTDITVTINNIQAINCSDKEADILKEYNIQQTPSIKKNITATKGKYNADIYVLPFYKDGEQLKKIVKATLNIKIDKKGHKKTADSNKHTFTSNSVLSTGTWYKVAVQESGIYKLTYEDIALMGVGDPAGVRIYGYGGAILPEGMSELLKTPDDLPEVAIYMNKGADGVFSPGDYILFYAQGIVKDMIQTSGSYHVYETNYYSNYGSYFVTSMPGEGKRIEPTESVIFNADLTFTTTNAGYYIQKSEYNLLESGREWYGYKCQGVARSHTFTIPDTNIDTSELMRADISLVANATQATTFNLLLNGIDTGDPIKMGKTTSSSQAGSKTTISRYIDNTLSSNPTIKLTYNTTSTNDIGYLNYLTLNYDKKLQLDASNNSILITNPIDLNDQTVAEYVIEGADANTQVWDITDLTDIKSMPLTYSGSTVKFKEIHNTIKKYMAVNTASTAYSTPNFIGNINNQNLHSLEVPDMVIISASEYMDASYVLADFHKNHDGFIVHVITPDVIYNEFSSGTPDASAYRMLMKMFYDRDMQQGGHRLKYLLFMGTDIYDNRGVSHPIPELLSYQSAESLISHSSYTTDDLYGMLDDEEPEYLASGTMDISVGRMPVTSKDEAMSVVNKTINYVTSTSCGSWRTLCSFLADNGDNVIHVRQADALADKIALYNKSFKIDKIFLDSYQIQETSSGTTFPGARDRILNNIQQGTLLFTYVGHGSPNTMATEQIINKNDIKAMYNKNLGLWITATCDFARFDNGQHSAGMEAILNPNGGAIALYTTTRVVYSADNNKLMQAIYEYIIPSSTEEHKSLGEIFRLAKVSLKNNSNKLNFSLLGDPAIKLHYPENNVITDKINNGDPADATMQALGIITIDGHIEDIEGNPLTNYSGTLNITVYDKEEELKTLGQAGDPQYTYKDYPNKLFLGNVSVENGRFSTTFMMPKDINYKYGNGRILYYALNENSDNDAFGSNYDFVVGGSDPSAVVSEDGPNIQLYMNAPEFKNGDKVNSSPVFNAYLYDKWGINVVGAGIGHDLTATLSGPITQSYNLNDYYTAELNTYQNGIVKYQFKNLPKGKYSLFFKAWNLQNVSNSASIDFVVDDKVRPTIEEFYIYPNPATEYTSLYLRYDRPDVPVSVTFTVYDLAWNEYWRTTVTESTNGVYTSKWDLSGTYGGMTSGVYVVRAKIEQQDGSYTFKNQKIIIKRQ